MRRWGKNFEEGDEKMAGREDFWENVSDEE